MANKALVNHYNQYKYYTTSWQIIDSTATENDYITKGMDDISIIPESAWQQLTGTVELCYYTDDPLATEAQFNIETNPFTPIEEFNGQSVKVIEYTDNPIQTETSVTIETEPFTFYDELGDSFDVLYYTDDHSKTFAELELNANYTPLDEIEGDFEVVTWTDGGVEEISDSLVGSKDNSFVVGYGEIYKVEVDLTKGLGTKRIENV